jgi:hypothetical protein
MGHPSILWLVEENKQQLQKQVPFDFAQDRLFDLVSRDEAARDFAQDDTPLG